MGPKVGSASKARADATASTASVFASRRARRRHFACVETGRCERDRDMSAPLRRALHTDPLDAVEVEQIDRFAVPDGGVVERVVGDLDTAMVDDPHGEGVLAGVDAPDWRCHAVLLAEVMFRWVRDRQERFVTTESRQSGSLLDRSAPAGPTLDAAGQSTGTRPVSCGVTAEHGTGP